MPRVFLSTVLGVCLLLPVLEAGPHSGDPSSTYQRILCVVPLIGAGTLDDPRRPMFTPAAGNNTAAGAQRGPRRKGFSAPAAIVAYHSVLTDDGKSAIVEFVARDRSAFEPLLDAKRHSGLMVFDREQNTPEQILSELRKVKKNFDFNLLRVGTL